VTADHLPRKSVAALRRLARTNAVRVPVLCILFGALLIATIRHAREAAPLSPSVGLFVGDPVAQFSQTRTGQLLFASNTSCRRVLFNNTSGQSYETGQVHCAQVPGKAGEASGADRMQALRKSFQKDAASP
jgi:hypothetical protein